MKKFFSENLKRLSVVLVIVVLVLAPITRTQADAISDLREKQKYWADQAKKAKEEAERKQREAEALKQQINYVANQISGTEEALVSTQNEIGNTEKTIEKLEGEIAGAQNVLDKEQESMSKVIVSWYTEGESGLLEALIGASNVSEVITKQQYYDSVRRQVESNIEKISAMKDELDEQKNAKQSRLAALSDLKESQIDQKKYLEDRKVLKNRLLNNTKEAVVDLQQEQKAAESKIAEITATINAIMRTKRWGGQILSDNDSSWYYNQLNYNQCDRSKGQTRDCLGPSPYSIALYGCLITSLAMISTFYGHRVTPPQAVAKSSFDRAGYLRSTSVATDYGTQSVNWTKIDQELANNHPVIVGVRLPGACYNYSPDGCFSHFIVLKKKISDKHYLMHDPLGDNRGYDLSQVKAMKIIRP